MKDEESKSRRRRRRRIRGSYLVTTTTTTIMIIVIRFTFFFFLKILLFLISEFNHLASLVIESIFLSSFIIRVLRKITLRWSIVIIICVLQEKKKFIKIGKHKYLENKEKKRKWD